MHLITIKDFLILLVSYFVGVAVAFSSTADLENKMTSFKSSLKTSPFIYAHVDVMRDFADYVENLEGASMNWSSETKSSLESLATDAFLARLEIRSKLNFTRDGNQHASLISLVSRAFNSLRYVEEYALRAMLQLGHLSARITYTTLAGSGPFFQVAPLHLASFNSYNDLHSGDIIMSRGNAYTSSAIANIGHNDYMFSHLSFVYEKNDALYTSEAHIEIGSVVAPFSSHLDEKNARSVVFRYKDENLAHRSSETVFNRVEAQQLTRSNIEYDFSMNDRDGQRLFCSEIVSDGFINAANLRVPYFRTKFDFGMLDFLQAIGIGIDRHNYRRFSTFAPGDLEFDRDFEIIADWKNPLKLTDSHQKDAVLKKIFELMEHHHYRFDIPATVAAKSVVAWAMRRAPYLRRRVEERFPLNMNIGQLKLFMILDQVALTMQNHLERVQRTKTWPMTQKDYQKELDLFVARDLRRYRLGPVARLRNPPVFHQKFHP